MVQATTNNLAGLVVMAANCRMNTFIGFVGWKRRQLDE